MLVLVFVLLFLLDCACGGGSPGGGRLVRGSKLVSLSEAVNLSGEVGRFLGSEGQGHAIKAGSRSRHQSVFGVVPSRQVLGRSIKQVCGRAVKAELGSAYGRRSCHGSLWFWV